MSFSPTFILAKLRHRRKRRAVEPPGPTPPPAALAVVGIQDLSYGGDVLSFVVVFDTSAANPLVDVALASPAKWTARYEGGLFEAGSLTMVNFDRVEVGMSVVGSEAGANVLNYSNAPSDIADALGRQLAAFSGFVLP